MKKMRRIIALAIAMIMVLGMSMSVFAANDGTITIDNTVNGKTYNVYKVFDATYEGTNVAYTYDGSNADFLTALQGSTSPFTVTANTGGSYNVVRKATATDDAIINFIKGQESNLGSAVATKTGDGGAQTVTGLAYGYYYITTTTGSNVTIDSALKDVTVIDKNEVIPVPEKTESTGTYTNATSATAKVGDTVNYKVTGKIERYNGTTLVTSLNFTDTMTSGLTPCAATGITIKVTEPGASQRTLVSGTDYTASVNGQVITITIPTATVSSNVPTFNFKAGTDYEITYSATVNENSIVPGTDSNTVNLKYNNDQNVGSDSTTIENYQITLTKQDATDNTKKLKGAEFDLYDALTGGNQIPVVLVTSANDPAGYGTEESTVNNVYRVAKSGETGVKMVTGKTGIIEVKGLNNGSYFFEETKAPNGYNKLTARTAATTVTDANATIQVDNNAGVELPSTGGIGTTLFYVFGAILVISAGVVLVTRRRMNER